MAKDQEWETIGNVFSQGRGTAAVEESSDGEWETLTPMGGVGLKAPQPSQERQSISDYLLGRATSGVARLGSAGAYSTAIGPGGVFSGAPTTEGLVFSPEELQQSLGIQPPKMEGQDAPVRYLGAGLEAVADPISYAFGGGRLPFVAAQNLLAGAGAEAGGDIGGGAEAALRGKESGVGRFIGNIFGSTAGAPLQGGLRYGFEAGGDVVAQAREKFARVKADPSEVESMVAAGAAKNFLEEAAKAGGKDYNTLINEFRDISQFVLGADAPLLLQASQNPVFKEELIRLAKTDPTKNAALDAEIKRIAGEIDRKSTTLFGARYAPIPASAPLDVRNVRKRLDQIQTQIEKLSDPFLIPEDKTDLGKAITNLVDTKQKLVRREMSKSYEALKQSARDAGITVDPQATEALYTFVKQNRILDIFGRQTDPEKKVSALLSPKQVEGVDILKAERVSRPEYKSLSFDDIDSLKRLVNEQQRKVRDPVQQKKLQDFEDFLNGVREQYVPPEFNNALKALDREFYERVGIPFDSQGVKELSSKAYADRVAPVILKNKDAYNDFVNVTGEQGAKLAQSAMINKAYSEVIKDGVINDVALRNFLKKNEEVLNQMPDVKNMMTNTRVANQELRRAQATLETQFAQAQKRIADNWFSGTQKEVPSFTQLTQQAFTNPNTRAKLLRDISDLSPEAAAAVRGNLRAEIVEIARNNPQGGIAFLTDPKNKQALDVMLGKGYQENLSKVLKMSDAVKGADISKLNLAVDLQVATDPVNRLFPGLNIQSTVSTIRRPIVSPVQKGVIMYSRVSQARATKAYDEMIFDVLTDPTALKKLAKTTEDLDLTFKNPTTLKDALNATIDSLPARVYIGLTVPEEAEQKPTGEDIRFINQIMQPRGTTR